MSAPHAQPATRPPVARLVLLGASNLRIGLPILLRVARAQLGGPLEVLVAHGHGRSYGKRSSIPGRTLPGITECDLWNDLTLQPSLPTFALLTDIGNDLLYGVQPAELVDWVEQCIGQLAAHEAKILLTALPRHPISRKSLAQYKVFRTIFFPACGLSLPTVLERAEETNLGLISIANQYQSYFAEMKEEWYGLDPIHVRRGSRKIAWRGLLQVLLNGECNLDAQVFTLKNRLALELAVPSSRRLLGRSQRRIQPSLTLDDGTTIAIY